MWGLLAAVFSRLLRQKLDAAISEEERQPLAESFLLPNDRLSVIAFFLRTVYDLDRLPMGDMALGSIAENAIEQTAHSAQSDMTSMQRSQRPPEELLSLGVSHSLGLQPRR
jgi:hypothetical protein